MPSTAHSLPTNHYHKYHYSVPTGAPHSRRTVNRATSCYAPADHPTDCSSGRSCSRGRAQFTLKQLVVSPHTILTHRVTNQKNTALFRLVLSTFQHFHSYYILLDRLQCTIHIDQDFVSPCNFLLDRSRFSTRDLYHIQRTASTLAFQWRVPPITMSSLRFFFSSMKTRKSHLHRRTIHLTRCRLNQLQVLQPRNPHHQPPPTSRQTNRFGPKYTPSNHHMP